MGLLFKVPANAYLTECGARFSKKTLRVAPAKSAHMQTNGMLHK